MPSKPTPHYTPLVSEAAAAPAAPSPALHLLPTDLLPRTASLDPRFNEAKTMHASAQDPGLARQYGVLRNGVHLPPQMLATPPVAAPVPTRSADPAPPKPAADPVARLEKPTSFFEVPLAPADADPPPALDVKVPAAPSIVSKSEDEEEKPTETYLDEPALPGSADLIAIREAVQQSVLNSPEQRKLVESRLKGKLSYTDYLLDRPVLQTVVIRPKQLEITFQVNPAELEFAIKEMIAEEAMGPMLNEYLMDKLHMLGVSASVHAINGEKLPGYLNEQGKVDRKRLLAKFAWLSRRPIPFIIMLSVQYIWFCDRYTREMMATDPKDG